MSYPCPCCPPQRVQSVFYVSWLLMSASSSTILLAPGLAVRYIAPFLPDADAWFGDLLAAVPWQQEIVTLYGQKFPQTRQTAQYGTPYGYNPTANQAQE